MTHGTVAPGLGENALAPAGTPQARPPRVSVIIPVLNGEAYIAKAIESVLAQTESDFELIVVDDGSTDGTAAIVRGIPDRRLRYEFQENRGLSGARNTGIRLARGSWLAFLDCDDYWLPGKLAAQLKRSVEMPSAGLIYCAASLHSVDGRMLGEIPSEIEGDVLPALLLGNRVAGSASSAMIRRDVIDAVGLFDESLRCCEDWDMWLRVAAVTSVAKVDASLVVLQDAPGSLGKKIEQLRETYLRVLESALSTFAASHSRLRRPALAAAHRTAAINFQEHGLFRAARGALIQSLRFNPLDVRMYWRLARALVNRR